MNSNYMHVLERLADYRIQKDMTQLKMGEMFGITQGHYAKLEAGTKIISYQSLLNFEKNGGDIYYLITGMEFTMGQINEYLSMCKTSNGKMRLFQALVWIIHRGCDLYSRQSTANLQKTYKSLRLVEKFGSGCTIWESIRKSESLSQIQMAEIFDIDVKRYRRIEKMEVSPDAEILNTLYCKLEYSPLVIFHRELYFLDELNHIWNVFPDGIRNKLQPLIQEVIVFIQLYEKEL